MKRKIIALCLIVAMLGVAVIGGTMAYFTDTAEAVNVMTIGSVKIEQIEQERNAAGELVPFTQAKPAIPAVYEGTSIPYAAADKWVVANDEEWKVVEDNENVIDKFITVKNTGKSSAYVRTIIAFEVGKDSVNDKYMHLVCNGGANSDWAFEWMTENGKDVVIEIDGGYYAIGVFTHTAPLAAGETTVPSVKQVYLDKTATNEISEGYGDTFEILAISQAIQASGFADAETALNEGFGEVTAAKAAEWFGDVTLTTVSTSEELVAAISNAKDGETIILAAGTYDSVAFTTPSTYTVKNLTLIGQEGTILNGLNFNDWRPVEQSLKVDGLTIENITFTKGILLSTREMNNVTVANCEFLNDAAINQNDGAEKLTNLTVRNCTFTGDVNGTTTAINLSNTENVTVTGCTFTNIDYNVLQAGVLDGTVFIDGNTVNGTGSRVFRFVTVNGDMTISNNTITSGGDENGELAKATNPCSVTLSGNTWNGQSDADVAAKLINITSK